MPALLKARSSLKRFSYAPRVTDDTGDAWFFIRVFFTLSSPIFLNLQKQYPNVFNSAHMIGPSLFISYLDRYDLAELLNIKKLSIQRKELDLFDNFSFSPYQQYFIRAEDFWIHDQCIHKKYETFHCNNISDEQILKIQNDPKVLRITPINKLTLASRFSSGYLQTGIDSLEYSDLLLRVPRKLQDIGLDGSDQIISVVDTGVDIKHSFFNDPNEEVTYNSSNPNHRKIIQYDTAFQNEQDINGHGTAVAGIISGTPLNNNDANKLYEGIAPASKLHILDLINDSTLDSFDIDPENQTNTMQSIGSYINHNSWQQSSVTSLSDEYTNASFKHKDILFVFPSGNRNQIGSIFSPSDCKNGITVGYTNRPGSSEIEQETRQPILTNESFSIQVNDLFEGCSVYQTESPLIDLHNLKISTTDAPNVAYHPSDCVSAPVEASLIIYSEFLECPQIGTTPAVYVSDNTINDIETVESILSQMNSVSVNFEFNSNTISVNTYSSQGPVTTCQLRKPDVVAPGENITTAKIGETGTSFDSLINMTGSSFAAAEVSGLAAIVRQYFTKGYYTTLEPNTGNAMTPSAALIKGVIINSAEPLTDEIHSYQSGFGVPQLSRALGFDDNIGVRFLDGVDITPSAHHQYNLVTTRTGKLSITMAYTDYIRPYDSGYPLYADIDLIVVSPNNNVYTGNNLRSNKQEEFSTVEKIIINNAPVGTYQIHIYSSNYDTQGGNVSIDYTLSIFGGFNTNDLSRNPRFLQKVSSPTCPNRCLNKGSCYSGICDCNSEFDGHYCQYDIGTYQSLSFFTTDIYPDVIQWNRIPIFDGQSVEFFFNIVRGYTSPNHLCLTLSPGPPRLSTSFYSGIAPTDRASAQYQTGPIDTSGITEVYVGYYMLGQTSSRVSTTVFLYPRRTPQRTPPRTPRRTPPRTPSPSPGPTPLPTPTFAPTLWPTVSQSIARTIHVPVPRTPEEDNNLSDGSNNLQDNNLMPQSSVTAIVVSILLIIICLALILVFVLLGIKKRRDNLIAQQERKDFSDDESESTLGNHVTPFW